MVVSCNPCLVFLLEHFYNRCREGVVNALWRSMNKLISFLLNPCQVGTYVGISQGNEVRVIRRAECDFVESVQSRADRGIPIQSVFQKCRRNVLKATTKEVELTRFGGHPKIK